MYAGRYVKISSVYGPHYQRLVGKTVRVDQYGLQTSEDYKLAGGVYEPLENDLYGSFHYVTGVVLEEEDEPNIIRGDN